MPKMPPGGSGGAMLVLRGHHRLRDVQVQLDPAERHSLPAILLPGDTGLPRAFQPRFRLLLQRGLRWLRPCDRLPRPLARGEEVRNRPPRN